MNHHQLFQQFAPDRNVAAGVIGTGHFATAIVTQSQSISRLQVPIVADVDIEAATLAYERAGIPESAITVCDSRAAALRALEQGKQVIVQDALLLMDLPLDVIVESTGVPEAGARHAQAAIQQGKHVAMVSKETDVTVGPILNHLAQAAGVVYTPVDGDQHGLLIQEVLWARELGLTVLTAGKARDGEYVYNPETQIVSQRQHTVQLTPEDAAWVQPMPPGKSTEFVQARQSVLANLPQVGGFDLVEMAIVTNATGLMPNIDTLHCPALYTSEIPQVLCPVENGGILQNGGIIDAITSLHLPHEVGLMGGVFMVVECDTDYSRHILVSKGSISNADGSTVAIYRPYHLCGVETPITILSAGLLGLSTGSVDVQPHVDVVMRATRKLHKGETLGNDHSPDLQALIRPAQAVANNAPLPLHMGNGNQLAVDVPAGTIITRAMVVEPENSVLWTLRAKQDARWV